MSPSSLGSFVLSEGLVSFLRLVIFPPFSPQLSWKTQTLSHPAELRISLGRVSNGENECLLIESNNVMLPIWKEK